MSRRKTESDGWHSRLEYISQRTRVVNFTVGGAGRDLQAQDSNGTYYARNATYPPFGGLTGMTNDSTPITTAGCPTSPVLEKWENVDGLIRAAVPVGR